MNETRSKSLRAPALFISHGAPPLALDPGSFGAALSSWAALHTPRAVAIVSAHWVARDLRVGGAASPELIFDFSGFPPELYDLTYPAAGAPEIAAAIADLLRDRELAVVIDRERGWDHGVWVPMRIAWPAANVPIVEISLPSSFSPHELIALGAALGELRDSGVMLVGSGGLVHNFAAMNFADRNAPADPWARELEDWVIERLRERDTESVASYRSIAPGALRAAPTPEHFDPLIVVAGAARADDRFVEIHRGFEYANLSLSVVAFE
jgi:4,5-DOPA dioxygenase extradiol